MRVEVLQIRDLLGADGTSSGTITRVGSFSDADQTTLIFAVDQTALMEALRSEAGLILAPIGSSAWSTDGRIMEVSDPRVAFAQVYQRWFVERPAGSVHETAVVGQGAVLGVGCVIGPGCVVGDGVRLGEHCVLAARVVVCAGTVLGDRVKVQAGAVLGSDGFGYVLQDKGFIGFPQIGTLWVGDDVEIGANTTIDRGALGETRIGRGTKIDNLVHIAHNCRIGENVLIAAQVGMAGSTVVDDGAMLGGQAGLGEHVTIGKGVILGGQGGVLPGKKIVGEGEVFWGTPARPVREYLRDLVRLRRR